MTEAKPHSPEGRLARAQKAHAELEFVGPYLDKLQLQYFNAWKDSDPRDVAGREALFAAVQVAGKVGSHLKTIIEDGKIAAKEIENLARAKAKGQKVA